MSLRGIKKNVVGSLLSRGFLFLFAVFAFSGCASEKEIVRKDATLLNDGNLAFAKNDFLQAEEAYKKLLDNYPESPYRINALMGYADTLFRQGNYMEAEWNYRDFYELYPVHADTEKAYFYSGMSHFNEMVSPDRDQTPTRKALEEFEKILNNPDSGKSPFYKEAVKKIGVCRDKLARRVFEIGKFYFRTREYLAAIRRFRELMVDYPELSYENEVVYMMGESYFNRDNFAEAGKFFRHLIENYSADSLAVKAKSRLAVIEAAGGRLSWN